MMPSWIPIEDSGMSIITAIILFCGGSAATVFSGVVWKRLDKHDVAINETKLELTVIKGDVKTTKEIVERMETNISEMGKTYAGFVERLLDNKHGRAD